MSHLERPFLPEEIKAAEFDLERDKALGPDAFPLHFFRQFWEIIKFDLLKLCDDFFFERANLERINWATIALIPKTEALDTSGDYRTISLINSSLKIL